MSTINILHKNLLQNNNNNNNDVYVNNKSFSSILQTVNIDNNQNNKVCL
jgi:hypothetical protein